MPTLVKKLHFGMRKRDAGWVTKPPRLWLAGCAVLSVLWHCAPAGADDEKFAPIRDKLVLCQSCHGPEGVPPSTDFPILAGQHLHYLYVQLKDYKSGLRANDIMQPIVADLDKEDMLLLAEYYSKKPWPDQPVLDPDPGADKVGKTVVNAGQCVACHLGGFEGNSRVPRVSGQHYEYLKKTMLDFKTKARNNSPAKGSLMASFSDEDIEKVSRYLSSFIP
jgi:cytochrome c553